MKKKPFFTKLYLTVLILSFFCEANGQTKNIKLYGKKYDGIQVEYRKLINFESKDTNYFVWIFFQNARYSTISDLKFITLESDNDIANFKSDLIEAFKQQDKKEGASMSWKRSGYSIQLTESNFLYLEDQSERGYCNLYRKNGQKIYDTLERIILGKDELLPEKN